MEGEADFFRDVQAAFKRHRSLGTMQSNIMKPRRTILPKRGTLKTSTSNSDPTGDTNKVRNNDSKSSSSVVVKDQEDATSTLQSTLSTVTETYDENFDSGEAQRDQVKPSTGLANADAIFYSHLESQQVPVVDSQKKVQFSLGNDAGIQDLEWDMRNQGEASTINNHDSKPQNLQHLEPECSLMEKKMVALQDRLHQFGNFLSQPVTQSSVAGSSCTSTLVNSTSAPMFNSTTYRDSNVNAQLLIQENKVEQVKLSSKYTNAIQSSSSIVDSQMEVREYRSSIEQQGGASQGSDIPKDPLLDNTNRGKGSTGDVTDVQSQAPMTKTSTLDLKSDPTKVGKEERGVSGKGTSVPRRKNYDPDLFFKVRGKLYQRLGKIGSGGSSEVHKVISSDCTIYALKKIRLKGRDYAMAYGFCQEILYLNKLKGKKNIIQLIDYEVTDKNLFQEVMNDVITNKDAKVKDDGYIYMVLEYGEIDLAHMLSQKWKEMNSCDRTIDENWLRFYWQQILQAVNTIHEERIVHSDLKPANFLLVKGSLKLIDFGIAKAILSDTTNIQRDSQVGTLSYMSPEAFMCNESDANGNIIKCGRPSDIWSLGCILYQMVYGRTPFSEYKTFWAKFKVITDPNHEIIYEPVSNPYLLDLMKNCLAWDRNERWRIPELLEHPFLVPPVPSQISSHEAQNCHLLQLITQTSVNDRNASVLCSQLQQLLSGPVVPLGKSELLPSRELQHKLVSEMSELCLQLKQHLASS